MSTIAVIGPGAVGGTMAAWLGTDVEHSVIVCARTKFSQLKVETPHGLLCSTPSILTSPDSAPVADWVLVATKAYDSKNCLEWLKSLCGPTTCVAVLQNGVEHADRFAPFPTQRLLPVIVECPAERDGPGQIRQRSDASMTVPNSALGKQFSELFKKTRIAVRLTNDFATAAWSKLCLNSAGAVSAVTLKPAGVVQVPEIAELMRGLVHECIAVGRAEGATLPDSLIETVISNYRSAPPDGVNSLHADRLAGRQMEIEARNGAIVRIGAKHGIAAPLNQAMVALLRANDGS